MATSLTLLDSGLVDERTIDKVLQAVVFFADAVAIRASYEVAPRARPLAAQLDRRIVELREAGLLQFWGHEYELNEAGRVTVGIPGGTAPPRPADLVVARGSLSESLAEMDEFMRSVREEAFGRPTAGGGHLREGTAEIVSLRNHLSSLVLSSELRQDGLLTNPAARSQLLRASRDEPMERFEHAVVRDVVAELGLGSLSQLSVDQIVESRRYNQDFRKLIDDALLSVSRGLDPMITPAATARELADRYRATVAEFARPTVRQDAAGEVVWDLLGSAVPPSVFVKYGLKMFKWRRDIQEVRPFLLLMHLERALNAHKNSVRTR